MGNKSSITYCWDSDVTLAWFKAEQNHPLDNMRLVVQEITGGKANLLLSVVTYIEVLNIAQSGTAAIQFRQFLKGDNVFLAQVDRRVAELATGIREAACNDGMNIKTPDAIIMATAINYSASVLHSFDMKKHNGRPLARGMKIMSPQPLSGQMPLPGV